MGYLQNVFQNDQFPDKLARKDPYMKRILSYLFMFAGMILVISYGYAFYCFGFDIHPLLLPLIDQLVLFSLSFTILGIILIIAGIILKRSAVKTSTKKVASDNTALKFSKA